MQVLRQHRLKLSTLHSFRPVAISRCMRPFLELVKYGLGSAVALAVDYGLLIYLTERAGLHYTMSAALGFSAGVAVAYILSINFVFEKRRLAGTHLEFAIFLAIGLFGLCLNQILLWSFVNFSGLTYALAKIPTAGLVFSFNFAARRALLFSDEA